MLAVDDQIECGVLHFLEVVAVAFLAGEIDSPDLEENSEGAIVPFDLAECFEEGTDREEYSVAVGYPWRFAEALPVGHLCCRCSCLAVDELLHLKQHQSFDLQILLVR